MNKQGENGIEYCDYTDNPGGGCAHECRFEMPSGDTAICYAESFALGLARKAYPNGFAHHYWRPHLLKEPLKVREPARIFINSMSDLMGIQVPDEHIRAVLEMCRGASWHTCLML